MAQLIGAEDIALLTGLEVLQHTAIVVVVDGEGVHLSGQEGLDKSKHQQSHHDNEEKHRHFVVEKGSDSGHPVGIVRVTAPFRLGGVELGEGEQFLLGKGGTVQLLLELLGEGVAQLVGLSVTVSFHQRAPSFAEKLIRGSRTAMRISPNSSPRIEMTE